MAGNSKLPFYSAVGSEFVEMFQGVAATRIRNLFKAARATAPSIVFIGMPHCRARSCNLPHALTESWAAESAVPWGGKGSLAEHVAPQLGVVAG